MQSDRSSLKTGTFHEPIVFTLVSLVPILLHHTVGTQKLLLSLNQQQVINKCSICVTDERQMLYLILNYMIQ